MLNFRLNFGLDFSCAFNFVWWISRDLSVRSGWFSEALGVFNYFRSLQSQISHSFDIHMSFCTSKVDISDPKNENFDEKMMFPKSIGDQSGMVPGPSGHQKTSFWMGSKLPDPWKKLKKWQTQKVKKIIKNLSIWRLFGPYFLKFPMLAHVLPGGGPRGNIPHES